MRHGIKVLGLSLLAALCMTAAMASSAEALLINSGEFLLSNGTFKALSIASETVTGQEVISGSSVLLFLEFGILLKCESTKVNNAVINVLGHGKGSLLYEGCQFYEDLGNGEVGASAECVPFDIQTNVLASVFLHGNLTGKNDHPYVLFRPLTGTIFATIAPEACLIPEENISGSVVAEISNPLSHAIKPVLKVNAGTLELFPEDKIVFWSQESHLTTEWEVWLTGANQGKAWGAT